MRPDPFGVSNPGSPGDHDGDEDDEHGAPLTLSQRAEWQRAERRHLRHLSLSAAVIVALFAVPALLATWNGAYYTWFAARATGTVVERQGGQTRKQLPSFVAAYTPVGAPAGTRLTIQSDGTEAYRGMAIGDRVTVLHDPADPARARLDFFWEVWIGAVIAWGLAAVVGLPVALFLRAARRRAAAAGALTASSSPPGR